MVYIINTNKSDIRIEDNRIYSNKSPFFALEVSQLAVYMETNNGEFKEHISDEKILYSLINETSLDEDGTIIIMIKLTDEQESIYKMLDGDTGIVYGQQMQRLLMTYIDIDCIIDSIDIDKLYESMPENLDMVASESATYDGKMATKLIYTGRFNENKLLFKLTEFTDRIDSMNSQCESAEELLSQLDMIESIVASVESTEDISSQLIDRLNEAINFMFGNCSFTETQLITQIYDEFYWNKFLINNDFSISLNEIKEAC